jgi:hypothetical protein
MPDYEAAADGIKSKKHEKQQELHAMAGLQRRVCRNHNCGGFAFETPSKFRYQPEAWPTAYISQTATRLAEW